jgi:hypothetical protein
MRTILSSLTLFAVLSGCKNDCQQLCQELAAYADEECGLTWTEEEIRECMANHKRSETTEQERLVCEANIDGLREEWTCDDLQDYFDKDGGSGGEGSGGDDTAATASAG